MDKFRTEAGRVAHVIAGHADGPVGTNDRTAVTLCGKSYVESELILDNDAKTCAACEKSL